MPRRDRVRFLVRVVGRERSQRVTLEVQAHTFGEAARIGLRRGRSHFMPPVGFVVELRVSTVERL